MVHPQALQALRYCLSMRACSCSCHGSSEQCSRRYLMACAAAAKFVKRGPARLRSLSLPGILLLTQGLDVLKLLEATMARRGFCQHQLQAASAPRRGLVVVLVSLLEPPACLSRAPLHLSIGHACRLSVMLARKQCRLTIWYGIFPRASPSEWQRLPPLTLFSPAQWQLISLLQAPDFSQKLHDVNVSAHA